MYIKPCPRCGRLPKIQEGCKRKNGDRFYIIGCPNYCYVLQREDKHPWCETKSAYLAIEGDYDYNYMYRRWNEELNDE